MMLIQTQNQHWQQKMKHTETQDETDEKHVLSIFLFRIFKIVTNLTKGNQF
jgi:hypothetical protein